MLTLCSFLRSVFRNARTSVLMAGVFLVAVMTFTIAGLAGGSQNAYAETSSAKSAVKNDVDTEEIVMLTEANVQFRLTDSESMRDGQLLVGNALAKSVLEKQVVRQERKAAVEEAKEEIRLMEEERARVAAEEAVKKAEEERNRQAAEAVRTNAVISFSDRDYDVLKRIVQAEAGVCDTKGKILVANVIINRVKSSRFPNNITDVVYQRSQFSPVSNGSINTCKVTQETIDAVNRALTGEDYSDGALFFMYRGASRSSSARWFDVSLTYLFQHERHEFFR